MKRRWVGLAGLVAALGAVAGCCGPCHQLLVVEAGMPLWARGGAGRTGSSISDRLRRQRRRRPHCRNAGRYSGSADVTHMEGSVTVGPGTALSGGARAAHHPGDVRGGLIRPGAHLVLNRQPAMVPESVQRLLLAVTVPPMPSAASDGGGEVRRGPFLLMIAWQPLSTPSWHGTDRQAAFGIAPSRGHCPPWPRARSPARTTPHVARRLLQPSQLADAYGSAIGYGPTLLALGVGAVAGLSLRRSSRHAAAERRTQSQAATQAPPSRGPVTELHADAPQPTTPAADSASLRLPQEPPVAPTAPAVPTAPANPPATQASTVSTNRLTACPACLQLPQDRRHTRRQVCPNCLARVDV